MMELGVHARRFEEAAEPEGLGNAESAHAGGEVAEAAGVKGSRSVVEIVHGVAAAEQGQAAAIGQVHSLHYPISKVSRVYAGRAHPLLLRLQLWWLPRLAAGFVLGKRAAAFSFYSSSSSVGDRICCVGVVHERLWD